MRQLGMLLAILFVSSCGLVHRDLIHKGGESRQFDSTDPVFNSYVTSFEAHAKNLTGNSGFAIGDVPINFGDTENENFEGVCFVYGDDSREIIVRKSWWDTAHPLYRESLLFHELGHCRLDREHDNAIYEIATRTIKQSMMASVIVNPSDYSLYQDAYLSELFTSSKSFLEQVLGI